MKSKHFFLGGLFFVFFFLSFGVHKFYVSVTQIDYVENKNRIEITTRIFIDDLEKALEKKHKKSIYLTTKEEIPEAKEFIKSYLNQQIKANVNNQPANIVFLGKEVENDVLIFYLKIDFSEKITTFEIFNSILTEVYTDQQNLIHTNINNNKKSYLLTKSEKTVLIKY